ncbi:MAG: hypothetical protein K0Q77_56 [Anaerosporomusa subterranea]|jgi:hypothetical protein|nr:hypothetical protein [Anaerosporomusa subterranea]
MGRYHDEIAADLAQSVGPTPFLGVPLGSVWLGQLSNNTSPGLADVITIKPSYTRFCLSIYEVKVSRADFLGDIRSEKWQRYLPHCHRFYFATLPDVARKEDIPPEAGWVVKGPNSWTYRKAAPARAVDIPEHTMLSLLFAKERDPRGLHLKKLRDADWEATNRGRFTDIGKLVGKEVAKAYADRHEVKDKIIKLDNQIYEMDQYLEAMREAIQLGLDMPKKKWLFVWHIKERLEQLKAEALKSIIDGDAL